MKSIAIALLFSFIACLSLAPIAVAADIVWVSSSPEQMSVAMPAPHFTPTPADQPPRIRVEPSRTFQKIDGFGGCFNELGWVALGKLPDAEKAKALDALFGKDGCAFTLARIPIGASDFALDGYSLDDTPGDLELKQFSIDRDRKQLLPFIKAAMTIQPELRCWASPWSPPAWMKTNNSYSRGSLKWEPAIWNAYASYFSKFIEAYRGEGVGIYAITPQNEPNILNVYPTCEWTGEQLREFIADYLGPTLKRNNANVELWLGLNGDPPSNGDNANARLVTVLSDPTANSFLTGVAFQYDSQNQIAVANKMYPDKKLMQSETECKRGDNSWADAQSLYGLMRRYFEGGANAYFAWNMVLDQTGMSNWKWRQNALITADEPSKSVRLNGEYHVMRHFSQFVKPGAKRAMTTGPWGDQIGFVNPDGSVVIVIGNSQKKTNAVRIGVGGFEGSIEVTLAAESINTIVVPPQR